MDRLQSLEIFVAIADQGSLAAAARALGLSAPSVTRGLNALEARLGVRLFTRTTRSLHLTDIGQAYLEDVRHNLNSLKTAEETAMGAAVNPVGTLRLTCPNEFGRIYIMPVLTAFLDRYPGMSVDVLSVDRVVHLVEEGFDIAIRIAHLPASGLSAVKVGQTKRVLCGAPAYFERYGVPKTVEDLKKHRIVAATTISVSEDWRFGRQGNIGFRLQPQISVSNIASAIEVARQGWGLTRVLSYQIGPDVMAGRLKTVLEDMEPAPLPIQIVHKEGRQAVAKVRCFVDFAMERLRAQQTLR